MFTLLTQAQFASGLGTENDWLLTSASDDTLLPHSARHQKKEKDAELSLHGARCDIRSFFFPGYSFPSVATPPGSGCSSLRDGAHLVVKLQAQGPRTPLCITLSQLSCLQSISRSE